MIAGKPHFLFINNRIYMNSNKDSLPEDIDYIYLLLLTIDSNSYLLCNKSQSTPSLMVYSSFQGLCQAIEKTGGMLKQFHPWPIYIPAYLHPGVKDLYLNTFILEVTGKGAISELVFKEGAGLLLLQVDTALIEKYKMIDKNR